MKRGVLLLLLIPLLFSCQSGTQVKRIATDSDIDLSGRWNDTDIRLVSEALVEESLSGSWIREYRMAHQGERPTVIVGTFLNRSSEHIDTAIITKRYEMALINSGQVEMVADQAFRASVREERAEQQYFASEETAKALGREIGADYLLQGAVRTNLDQQGNELVRTYYVSAELIDIETNRKVWVGEETIKKHVKRPKFRF
ncbi:MAG TPA: penicillin-binding protein activator LpoB [Sphaerochaeta sp.]|nr:penicillin-binding protein activator LpoB [Sphaerochaeta sp.]